MMRTRSVETERVFSFRTPALAVVLLALLFVTGVQAALADTLFKVSATFSDNNSTPFTGTVEINTQTGAIDQFYFNIPTMNLGTTTLAGALFTPDTATPDFTGIGYPCTASLGSFITFQLFGAPSNSEELYLLIPQSSLISYNGGALLQQVTCSGKAFHTGYQSGLQSNPFIEITANGSITPSAVPEPAAFSYSVPAHWVWSEGSCTGSAPQESCIKRAQI